MRDLSTLPEVYISDTGDRVTEPAYQLNTMHFFDDTLWHEGDIIVTNLEPTPHMEPLNQAAGERIEQWLSTLPQGTGDITLAELTEAAMMLRPREGEPELTTEQFQGAVLKLAAELKAKRRGSGPVVPNTQSVRPAASKGAPPLANARFSNADHHEAQRRVQFQPQAPNSQRVRKAVPQAGNLPTGIREGQ